MTRREAVRFIYLPDASIAPPQPALPGSGPYTSIEEKSHAANKSVISGVAAPPGEAVIARMWRGWTRSWDADVYAEHLRQTAIPQCRQAHGNNAAYILRRGVGDRTEFAVLTLWQSLDAVRAFAGEDIERSVPSPEDTVFLTGIQPAITHYEVIGQQ